MSTTPEPPLTVGESVRLRGQRRYLKSADPMPMLRPPDLVQPGEEGVVLELRAGDQLAVRFRRGTFLLAAGELSRLTSEPPPAPGPRQAPPDSGTAG
ncbi:MAG: NAD(P)H dehydrogenase assembly family protein [Cyanobacteriota bacterium]|jgi:hypothetical protein